MCPIRTAAWAAIALLIAAQSASAQTVTTVSPFASQGFQPALPNAPFWAPAPYWTRSYWSAPYWAPQGGGAQVPGTTALSPGVVPPRPFAESNEDPTASIGPSCVASGYMCPAAAPAGQPCVCLTNDGRTIDGVVR